MPSTRSAAIVVIGVILLAACGTEQVPIAPPFTPEQLTQLRNEYRQSDRLARVGLVTAVLPNDHLAAVGDIPVHDFDVGDVVTFIDSNRRVLTMGTVEAINGNSLTVRYAPPGPKSRAPVEGDAAVRAIH